LTPIRHIVTSVILLVYLSLVFHDFIPHSHSHSGDAVSNIQLALDHDSESGYSETGHGHHHDFNQEKPGQWVIVPELSFADVLAFAVQEIPAKQPIPEFPSANIHNGFIDKQPFRGPPVMG
jgi:hypothetical protein